MHEQKQVICGAAALECKADVFLGVSLKLDSDRLVSACSDSLICPDKSKP